MTERERLTKLVGNATVEVSFTRSDGEVVAKANRQIVDLREVGILAEYLLANGVIAPPCKVGDIVWSREGEPHKVVSIEWYSPKVMHLHCEHRTFSVGKRSLGRTVFLTREEAEEALERSKG